MSESEFRKLAELGRAVKPTAVINNKDRVVFDAKETRKANLVLSSSSSSTASTPAEAAVIKDQGDKDSEYQSDDVTGDEDDYEMEESSGEGTVQVTEYKLTRTEVGTSNGVNNNMTNEIAEELNGNEI